MSLRSLLAVAKHILYKPFPILLSDTEEGDPPLPEGVSVTAEHKSKGGMMKKTPGGALDVACTLLISIPSGIALNLVSSWLFQLFTNHAHKSIRIQEQEIEVEEGEITRIVTKTIEIKE